MFLSIPTFFFNTLFDDNLPVNKSTFEKEFIGCPCFVVVVVVVRIALIEFDEFGNKRKTKRRRFRGGCMFQFLAKQQFIVWGFRL